MTKPTKRACVAWARAHRQDRHIDDDEGETSAFFGEVETIDEIAPTLLALLQALPSGTRIYLRLKRTFH